MGTNQQMKYIDDAKTSNVTNFTLTLKLGQMSFLLDYFHHLNRNDRKLGRGCRWQQSPNIRNWTFFDFIPCRFILLIENKSIRPSVGNDDLCPIKIGKIDQSIEMISLIERSRKRILKIVPSRVVLSNRESNLEKREWNACTPDAICSIADIKFEVIET